MRKLLISILLASAAASPALAQDRGDNHDRGERAEHQQAREQRQQVREERSQAREQVRAERSGGGGFEARQQQADRAAQFEMRRQAVERAVRANPAPGAEQRSAESHRQRGEGVSRWTRDNVQQAGETSRWTRDPNQHAGETSRWTRDRTAPDATQRSGSWARDRGSWSGNRDGDYRQNRGDRTQSRSRWANGGWNRNWRNDRRYDWRSYRDRHRSAFHIGVYFDPFGYNYRPFDIGYRLQPLYFGQRYWIDPGMYQLPYPPPGTQWVRYWNDAVLVDMYSGEVVDVIRNFFW
jgi:Ni/Co efflux regulator RcnB